MAHAVVGVIEGHLDVEDVDFEDIAGLGAFDIYGAGEKMAARGRAFFGDRVLGGLDFRLGHSGRFEQFCRAYAQSFNDNRVAGRDLQHRGGGGIVVANNYSVGSRRKTMGGLAKG